MSKTRKNFADQGSMIARDLGLGLPNGSPGLAEFAAEAGFASIWDRPALTKEDRFFPVLATLAALDRQEVLSAHIKAALNIGLTPRAIQEIIIQCALYGGLPLAITGLTTASQVFDDHGLSKPETQAIENDQANWTCDELALEGRRIMKELHGERSGQGYAAPEDPATSALYEVAIRYGYGVIWSRPGLTWRQRMLVGVAAFTSLRLPQTLTKFAESALGQGLSREQLVEAIMQTAPYGGFPPALTALSQVRPILFPAS